MSEQMDSILRTVQEMKDSLADIVAKSGQKNSIPNADAIKKDELEKMKADILLEVEKLKAVSSKPAIEEVKAPKIKLAEFMKAVKYNDHSIVKTSMSEGTSAQGGYGVPTEYTDMIVGALNNMTYVINRATPFIHNQGFTKNIPKWLTDLTVYWVDESTLKTQSKPTLTNVQSVLKKICALITASDEYLEDDITGMEQKLAQLVAENISLELERLMFIGSTGGGDAFNGIFSSTPISVTQVGANIAYVDIVNLLNQATMFEQYRVGAELFMNRTMLGKVMGIVDLAGRPIWSMQLNGQGQLQNTILGVPVTVSSPITNTCSTLGAKSVIFYGNPSSVLIGKRAGNENINLLVSQHGIISTGGGAVSTNLYQQDETGYRFVMRRSIVVPVATAWTVLDEAN